MSKDRRRRPERGSVLFLFPAGFLAMLVLGAIAIDSGNAYLQQRALADAADAAANDAVTYGLDEDALRAGGEYQLDPGRVSEAVSRAVAGADLGPGVAVTIEPPRATGAGRVEITVHLTRTIDYIFGGAIPGTPGGITVRATGVAEATFEP